MSLIKICNMLFFLIFSYCHVYPIGIDENGSKNVENIWLKKIYNQDSTNIRWNESPFLVKLEVQDSILRIGPHCIPFVQVNKGYEPKDLLLLDNVINSYFRNTKYLNAEFYSKQKNSNMLWTYDSLKIGLNISNRRTGNNTWNTLPLRFVTFSLIIEQIRENKKNGFDTFIMHGGRGLVSISMGDSEDEILLRIQKKIDDYYFDIYNKRGNEIEITNYFRNEILKKFKKSSVSRIGSKTIFRIIILSFVILIIGYVLYGLYWEPIKEYINNLFFKIKDKRYSGNSKFESILRQIEPNINEDEKALLQNIAKKSVHHDNLNRILNDCYENSGSSHWDELEKIIQGNDEYKGYAILNYIRLYKFNKMKLPDVYDKLKAEFEKIPTLSSWLLKVIINSKKYSIIKSLIGGNEIQEKEISEYFKNDTEIIEFIKKSKAREKLINGIVEYVDNLDPKMLSKLNKTTLLPAIIFNYLDCLRIVNSEKHEKVMQINQKQDLIKRILTNIDGDLLEYFDDIIESQSKLIECINKFLKSGSIKQWEKLEILIKEGQFQNVFSEEFYRYLKIHVHKNNKIDDKLVNNLLKLIGENFGWDQKETTEVLYKVNRGFSISSFEDTFQVEKDFSLTKLEDIIKVFNNESIKNYLELLLDKLILLEKLNCDITGKNKIRWDEYKNILNAGVFNFLEIYNVVLEKSENSQTNLGPLKLSKILELSGCEVAKEHLDELKKKSDEVNNLLKLFEESKGVNLIKDLTEDISNIRNDSIKEKNEILLGMLDRLIGESQYGEAIIRGTRYKNIIDNKLRKLKISKAESAIHLPDVAVLRDLLTELLHIHKKSYGEVQVNIDMIFDNLLAGPHIINILDQLEIDDRLIKLFSDDENYQILSSMLDEDYEELTKFKEMLVHSCNSIKNKSIRKNIVNVFYLVLFEKCIREFLKIISDNGDNILELLESKILGKDEQGLFIQKIIEYIFYSFDITKFLKQDMQLLEGQYTNIRLFYSKEDYKILLNENRNKYNEFANDMLKYGKLHKNIIDIAKNNNVKKLNVLCNGVYIPVNKISQ